MPAAGHRSDDNLYLVGYNGYYWSSSLDTDNPFFAYSLYFYSVDVSTTNGRYFGRSVRPVSE